MGSVSEQLITSTKDFVLSIAGFIMSLYGGFKGDLFFLTIGVLTILLNLFFIFQTLEKDVDTLKSQINIQLEIKKLWGEIEKIKNEKPLT